MIFRRIEIIQHDNIDSASNRDEQASDRFKKPAETRHGSAQSLDDVDSSSQESESSDDEISEYKRIRLVGDGRTRWDSSTCAQELRINKTGLGVVFPGPQTFVNPDAFAFVGTTPRSKKDRADYPSRREMYFEIKIRSGEVCVGFCFGKTPSVAMLGIDGVYAYSSNDGRVFKNPPDLHFTTPSILPGGVVGCGLDGRTGYFILNGKLICEFTASSNTWDGQVGLLTSIPGEFAISRKYDRSSLSPIVGLREGASVVANFGAKQPLLPRYVRTWIELWVCCKCGDTCNAAPPLAQCISCLHNFGDRHCTKEIHNTKVLRSYGGT